jgi:hypothetical protein
LRLSLEVLIWGLEPNLLLRGTTLLKRTVQIVDDHDGTILEDPERIPFTFDGVEYETDLGHANAEKFREAMAPWCENATQVGGRRRGRPPKTPNGVTRQGARAPVRTGIRQWARANGYPDLSNFGKIPEHINTSFDKARDRGEVA